MATPTVRAVGAAATGTTSAVTVAAPAGVATGDLELMFASVQSGGTIALTTNGGSAWTAMGGSPVDPGVATTSDKLYIWWRIRQAGDGNPTLTASVDHIETARIAITAGTFDTATPIEIAVSGTEATSDTSMSFAPGNSTAGPNRLCFVACTSGVDSSTGQGGATVTNANLTSLTLRANYETLSGGGGGFWIGSGIRATAGAIGTWSNTMVSATPKAYISFAVRPSLTEMTFVEPAASSGVLDDFNHNASTNLNTLPGWDAGILWTGETTLAINSVPDAAVPTAASAFRSNVWGTAFTDAETWAEVGALGAGSPYTLDLGVRVTAFGAGASTYYALEINLVTGDFSIFKYVGGSSTLLATNSVSTAHAAGDAWKIRVIGSTITAWRRTSGTWAQQTLSTGSSVSDSAITGAGRLAIEVNIADVTVKINEFGGGAVGTGGGTSTSTFNLNTITGGPHTDALSFTSTGTSTSAFALNRRRTLTFTSAGTSTSSFALALVVIGSPGPYYGPQILNEGLYNNRIGLFGWKQANKERLEHGGSLLSISAYVVGTGSYGAGTGGSMRCRVETDNGSGRPSGTLVATGAEATLTLGRTTQVSTWTFGTPPTVTQGQLVHFVWENVDASPTVNYVSIDNIDVSGYEKLPQPTIPDSDRFVSLYDSGAWIDANDQYYPIFRTLYGDGYKGGQSHYECGTPRYMGGTQKVRQKITPTATHVVRRVNVAIARYPSTTNDLTLTLRNLTASTVLDTRTIPVGAIHQAVHTTPDRLGCRHVGVELSAPVTLSPGTVYALELSSAETVDPYMTAPTRIGGVPASFGALFDAADREPDMLFEYTTDGSTWLTETGQSQAQLYFHTTAAGAALAFTSAGTSTSTFTLNRRRTLSFTSTGTSASTFTLNRRRPLTFTSSGTSASTFALNRARPLTFTSAGTSASTFSLNRRRALTFTSAGTSTSTFVLARRRPLSFTSAGTSASTFTLTSQHAPAIIALAFTSAGTSTSSFTLNRRRPLSFTSTGTSASTFALNVRRGLAFTSTGTSTSTFALTQRRALSFTSAGTSASVFALNRRRPLTFTSTGTSTSTFTLVSQHAPAITALAFTSTGTSTSSFALNRRRPLTFTSTGTSTSTFSLSRRRALAFTSTGTSTSTFALNRRRALAFTSAGTSTSSFALNHRRALTFTSTGTSASTFALTQRRALTFTSAGVGTSTFSLNRRRPLSFTSTGTSASTFTLATQHVPTQVALAFTSTGTSTSTFALTTQHAPVKREMTFTSTGVGTSIFAFRAKRALAFTSAGTSTSTFSFAAKRALTFTSAGVGTSSFALTRRRALSMTSSGVGTSTFTLTRRRALAFLSSGLSASSFAFQVRPGLHLNSTGVGTSTFTFTVIRNVGPILTAIIACTDPRSGVTSDPEPEPASTLMSGPSGGILSSPRPGEVG